MSDTITLPRELVKFVLQHLEWWSDDEPQEKEAITALRTALAAEQPKPKPEPVAYFDLQKQVFFWAKPTQIDVPKTIALEPLPLYTAPPDAEALRRDAFRKGFYAGFAATGEGWNGEYPFQDKNRPIAGDPSVEAALDAAMKEGT